MNRHLVQSTIIGGVLLLSSLSTTDAAMAQGRLELSPGMACYPVAGSPESNQYWLKVRKELVSSMHPSKTAVIIGTVKTKQFPEAVSIHESSGNAQFDADCLVAVLSCQRDDSNPHVLRGVWPLGNEKHQYEYTFEPTSGAVKIFTIPLVVLDRYPGIFQASELLAKSNEKLVSRLPSEEDTALAPSQVSEITKYMQAWNEFFQKNPTVSKELILSEAKRIEKKSKGGDVSVLPSTN